LDKANKEAEEELRKAKLSIKEFEIKLKEETNREIVERRNEISALEKRNFQREEQLNKKEERIEKEIIKVQNLESEVIRREKEVSNFEKERESELEKIALLSKDEARQIIISELEKTLHFRKAKMIKKYEEEIRDDSRKIAKEIIVSAIQKCAADHTSTSTVSIVELPNDDIKGRIIGKDGRNIRSLEMCTGVQIIVDDTPESITISAFDPVRRAIAKLALEKLIEDR
jgi:2',3'-cyclic-nucleotide 2'-phosphodiesterase